jgi:hypothetical protein
MKNNFMKFKPYWILTAEQVMENLRPTESLINEGSIISKDFEGIIIQKQNQFSKEPQLYKIECPDGYMRFLTSSPILPLVFAKPTNKGIFPSTNLDLNEE